VGLRLGVWLELGVALGLGALDMVGEEPVGVGLGVWVWDVNPERDSEGSKVAVAVPEGLRVPGDRVRERLRVLEDERYSLPEAESVRVKV